MKSKLRTTTKIKRHTRAGANGIAPVHPGEMLREEFLIPMGVSAHALAMSLQVPGTRISEIVKERRGISGDTALRLGRYFRMRPEFWMNLQSQYELEVARTGLARRWEAAIKPAPVDQVTGELKQKRTA